jgi:uncharacterized membrane protein
VKCEKNIKKAGYIVIIALLALIFWCYWVWHQIERGDAPSFLSDKGVNVVLYICALIFYVVVALMIFIVVRAFYLWLTKSAARQKHERDG